MFHLYAPWKYQKTVFSDTFRGYRISNVDWKWIKILKKSVNIKNKQTRKQVLSLSTLKSWQNKIRISILKQHVNEMAQRMVTYSQSEFNHSYIFFITVTLQPWFWFWLVQAFTSQHLFWFPGWFSHGTPV